MHKLFIKSKIQFFESKSQLWCKGKLYFTVVYQVKDTIFWKQITTIFMNIRYSRKLFIKSKIQFFESKSQHSSIGNAIVVCCLSSQRYNFLKANHNRVLIGIDSNYVVYQVKDTIFWKQITTICFLVFFVETLFIKSKIQFFESKSQLLPRTHWIDSSCLSSQRYNFLKANHNRLVQEKQRSQVVYQVKDTIFWKQITTPFTSSSNSI